MTILVGDRAADVIAGGMRVPGQPLLHPREHLALVAVANGHSCKTTGLIVYKSTETVTDWVETARRKLTARNTTHAVALAFRAGLIDPAEIR